MKFHIVGTPRSIAISQYNGVIGVGGDDGRYQIIKLMDAKPTVVFNQKLKGPKRDVIVYRQSVSADGRFAAFAAMKKIFLVDVDKSEIIREFDLPKTSHVASVSRFMNNGNLCFVNSSELCVYDIQTDELHVSTMPDKQDECFDMAFHENDSQMLYQSSNYNHASKLTLFNLLDHKVHSSLSIPISAKYIPGQGMASKRLAFVKGTNQVVCMRKDVGITYYDISEGSEQLILPYEELGFRSLIFGDDTRFSADGRYVMVHAEGDMLEKYTREVEKQTYNFQVNPDIDLSYVIYDLHEKKIIFSMGKISMEAAFSVPSNLFVHLGYETVNGKYKGYIGMYPIVNS